MNESVVDLENKLQIVNNELEKNRIRREKLTQAHQILVRLIVESRARIRKLELNSYK